MLLPITNSYPRLLFLILDEFLRLFFEQNKTTTTKKVVKRQQKL